jgi:hypothetical protein
MTCGRKPQTWAKWQTILLIAQPCAAMAMLNLSDYKIVRGSNRSTSRRDDPLAGGGSAFPHQLLETAGVHFVRRL